MNLTALFFVLIIQKFSSLQLVNGSKCRVDFYHLYDANVWNVALSFEEFSNHACSACYINIPSSAFNGKQHAYNYNPTTGLLVDAKDNITTYESGKEYKNESSVIFQSFASAGYASFWVKCCESAQDCCREIEKVDVGDNSTCPPVWDGLQCWLNATESSKRCPDFYPTYIFQRKSSCKRYVRKHCNKGTWKRTSDDECKPYEYYRDYTNNADDPDEKKCCRADNTIELSYRAFRLHSCASCYEFIDTTKLKINPFRYRYQRGGTLYRLNPWEEYYADLEANTTVIIQNTLTSVHYINLWKTCCRKAMECCDQMLRRRPPGAPADYCPQTWDGWSCYDFAQAGTTAHQECPLHSYYVSSKPRCSRVSLRTCLNNGSWQLHPIFGLEKTDYSTCGNQENLEVEQEYVMGLYAVSLTFLVVALIPFFAYRQLQVHRISIHKNLFVAMAMTCFFSILQYRIVILASLWKENNVLDDNGAGCQILNIFVRYSVLSGHFWMLCEGIHLHQVITAAFKEQKNLRLFYLIGWGIPILPASIFAVVLKTLNQQQCWCIVTSNAIWIVIAPSILCLLLNFILLCNIIRVLVTKLSSVQSNEPTYFRKALRATIFLIPLMGLHQLISCYHPDFSESSCSSLRSYILFQYTVQGTEGMVVSLLFSYLNGEVLFLVRRSYEKFRDSHTLPEIRSRLSFSTQISTVVPDAKRVAETQH